MLGMSVGTHTLHLLTIVCCLQTVRAVFEALCQGLKGGREEAGATSSGAITVDSLQAACKKYEVHDELILLVPCKRDTKLRSYLVCQFDFCRFGLLIR